MMKITIQTLILCLFCAVTLHAQGLYTVKGSVIDSASNTQLTNTTICVLNAKDSTLRKFTRAATNGSFTIGNLGKGKFILMITYPGYADYIEQFSLDSANTTHNFGKINLQLKATLLHDVIIKGDVAAIKIKGDTTEFNAAAYKIQPNSKVEDLLKQLPGIQVDKDGKITAQGQTVQKVLVDGEEFFGDDPTLVTKNIRGDMVDKIQLYDKKSDQATFTGIDDGQTTKTINVKLKEDKKNGYFGKLDGGAGTRNFYQGQAMYNQFQGKKKFSAYAIAANTGKVGLGWDDAAKYGLNSVQLTDDGGIIVSSGGGSDLDSFGGQYDGHGIPVARAGGAHYDDKWNSDKQSVNANYKIGSLGVEGDTKTITQNNLPNGFILNNSDQSYNNNVFRQKLDITYQTKLDSTSDLKLYVDGTGKESKTNNNSYTSSADSLNNLLNTNNRTLTNDVKSQVFNASAFYTRKFKKTGRTLSVLASEAVNNSDANGYLNSTTKFYNGIKDSIIDQQKINKLRSSVFGSNITYTEPFGKKLSLVLNYGINVNYSSADRKSYDQKIPGSGNYDSLDVQYSNNYVLHQLANQGGAVLNYRTAKSTLNVGTKATDVSYTQTDEYAHSIFERSFLNWSPQATYQYRFSQQTTLRVGYNGSTRQPTLDQLQTIKNNNDPLNIVQGNPDLKPSFTNRFNAYYNSYKVLSDQSFYISGNYSYTSNQIVSNRTYDDITATSITKSENLTGKLPYNYSVYSSFNKKLKWLGNFSAGISANTDGGVSYGKTNSVLNVTSWQNYSAQISLSKYMANKYDFYISFGPNYSFNKNSLQPKLPNNGGGSNGNLYFSIYLPAKIQIGSDGSYQFKEKTRVADAYQTLIVNSYISKKFLKSEGLKLTLSGNDIFNQNLGINRSTFSTSTYTTIKRYFLFSISWDFSKMGGAPEPKK